MKVALCLSGNLRSFESNLKSLNDNLLSLYDHVDVFIATWSCSESHKIQLLNPKGLIVEPEFTIPASDIIKSKNIEPLRNINNVLSMFYKIEQSNALKKRYELENKFTYDYVIRSRPDIRYLSPVNIGTGSGLHIPKWGDFFGLNDQLAFGESPLMDIYSNVYSHIEEILLSDTKLYLKPELILKKHLELNNVLVTRPEINYVIVRADGSVLDNKSRDEAWNIAKHPDWELLK